MSVKIRCVSERRPWVQGRPLSIGDEVSVEKDEADVLVDSGMFERIANVNKRKDSGGGQQGTDSPKPRRKRNLKRDS